MVATKPTAPARRDKHLPATRDEADALIWKLSRRKAKEALGVDELANRLIGIVRLTGQIERDYAGRFLIELIQNAYDAHDAGASGKIQILLDPAEGANGTLYVANTGNPFDYADVQAISELAQSTKDPDKGIGNKGVGFKSVFVVSDGPEVYSMGRGHHQGVFDGFCFRFAGEDDYRLLANTDDEARDLGSRMGPESMPIPLTSPQPASVSRFAADGHNVVVRLPLGPRGSDDARPQIHELAYGSSPVLLFLDRIAELKLEINEPDGMNVTMTRSSRRLRLTDRAGLQEVELGEQGLYVLASRPIDHGRFLEAIRQSVDAKRVDDSWLEWSEPAVVSVAVRADADHDDDRLYCYLPMGADAHSPFHGHLNAPFVVPIARKGLLEDTPINELILDEAAKLCADIVLDLRNHSAAWRVVVDIATWRSPDIGRLQRAFQIEDLVLGEVPFLPVIGASKWASLSDAYQWPESRFASLTPGAISNTGARILEPGLGARRFERLETLSEEVLGGGLDPDEETLAIWIERVAAPMGRRHNPPIQSWLRFYDDLAELGGEYPNLGDALRGRKILLDDAGELRDSEVPSVQGGKTRRRKRTVFFQPGSDPDDDEEASEGIRLSPALRRRMTFMHPNLRWTVPGANPGVRVLRPGRRFLEDENLVRRWRSSDLLDELTALLSRDHSPAVSRDALRLAFDIRRRDPRAATVSIAAVGLRVPTRSGQWILATGARFSAGWPETLGLDLEALLSATGDHSPELASLGNSLLVSPDQWPFAGNRELWVPFLIDAGVKDGLEPVDVLAKEVPGKAWSFSPSYVASRLAMSTSDRQEWLELVADTARPPAAEGQAQAFLRSPALRIPGQGEFSLLPLNARLRFGRLVLAGLGQWGEQLRAITLDIPYYAVQQRWASPAWAFLLTHEWVPVRRPGERDLQALVRPSDAWHFSESDDEALPGYGPLLPAQERARIDHEPNLAARLVDLGLRRWGDPKSAGERLRTMPALFATGDGVEGQIAAFRKAYVNSWSAIAGGASPLPWPRSGLPTLVATRRGQVVVYDASVDDRALYVLGDEDKLAHRILESRDVVVLEADPKDGVAIAEILRPLLGERIQLVRSGDIEVFADGAVVQANDATEFLVTEERSWLVELVVLTLELSSTQFNRQSDRTVQQAVDRLRRLRIRAATEIRVGMDGQIVDLPTSLGGVVPIADDQSPMIVFTGAMDPMDWGTLRTVARAVAELIGQPLAGEALRGHVGDLGADLALPVARPSESDYAAALGQDRDRIREVLDGHRSMLSRVLFNLRPIVEYFSPGSGDRLVDPSREGVFADDLERQLVSIGFGPSEAFDPTNLLRLSAEHDDLQDIRDELQLDFARFNAALEALGEPYRPYQYPDDHWAALTGFLTERSGEVYDRLRSTHFPVFERRGDLSRYRSSVADFEQALGPRARLAKGTLRPDNEWLRRFKSPPAEALGAVLNVWLASQGADLTRGVRPQIPVEEVRRDNDVTVANFASKAAVIVHAWTAKAGANPPSWVVDGGQALGSRLFAMGCLDFELLDDAEVVEWAAAAGEWPHAMPYSVLLPELGLVEQDLRGIEESGRREREATEREKRSMNLDDKPLTLDSEDRLALLETLEASVTPELLNASREAQPLRVLPPRSRGGNGGGQHTPPTGLGRLTDAQKELVGFVAEWFAFQWLTSNYRTANAESWVSRNRRFVFANHEGDDSLGYDFFVSYHRGNRFFEVKAGGDPTRLSAVELSDNEVRFAQTHARGDQYQILLVSNPLDKGQRRLTVLPNPFSDSGQGKYRVAGSGIKYAFRLE